jgi:hypothetical protein
VPLPPPVTVSHDAELDVDHVHVLPAVTPTVPVVAAVPTVRVVGENAYVHDPLVPLCVSVKVLVPTVSVADRADDPALAATL